MLGIILQMGNGQRVASIRLLMEGEMIWKIPVLCLALYLAVNIVAATYLFFKEKNEMEMIVSAIENADKEG
tara:strand:+ start:1615 stop:1827 length:213 start_codon:yes stop_codon:yes gene_type:complete